MILKCASAVTGRTNTSPAIVQFSRSSNLGTRFALESPGRLGRQKSGRMNQALVLGCKGCGSAIAEIFLKLGEIPYEREEVDYEKPGADRDRLLDLNPLGQVPTILLANGTILTETLAVAHYVNFLKPHLELIPRNIEDFVFFHRWSIFFVAALYPTFTFGDTPAKWVMNEEGASQLRQSTDEHRKRLWMMLEAQNRGPYFLGPVMSAIDIFFAVAANWRPRKEWIRQHCPKVNLVADLVSQRPEIASIWEYNFETSNV